MQNWVNYILVAKEFGINSDILETNVINIILLIFLLLKVVGNLLNENLNKRYADILNVVQGSEKKLTEANQRLVEAKMKWSQANIVLENLRNKTFQSSLDIFNKEIKRGSNEISKEFNNNIILLVSKEKLIFNFLTKQLILFVLQESMKKLNNKLDDKRHSLMIDQIIKGLKGKL